MQGLQQILYQFFSYATYPFFALLTAPTWIFSVPGKVFGLAVHWRVGLFIGLLTTAVAAAVLVQRHTAASGADRATLWWQIAGLAVLIPAETVAVAFAIRYWLMSLPSRYPEIDAAWQAGIGDLHAAGILLESRPLYVVLGVPNPQDAAALMGGAGDELLVAPREDAATPLLWAATGEAIYLFVQDCQATKLVAGRDTVVAGAGRIGAPAPDSMGASMTIGVPGDFAAAGFVSMDQSAGVAEPVPMPPPRRAAVELRMDTATDAESPLAGFNTQVDREAVSSPFATLGGDDVLPPQRSGVQPATAPQSMRRPLPARDAEILLDKVDYVGQKLRLALQPLCPATGILVVMPYTLLARGQNQARMLGEVVRADLNSFLPRLQCRPHVTVLVSSLDAQPGFPAFLNRFQSKAPEVLAARFGKGMGGTWTIPSGSALEGLAHAACHQFESWIFQMLKTAAALREANNRDLFRLLARMRGDFDACLKEYLCAAFECADKEIDRREWLPVSGCYFVGLRTDAHTDRLNQPADDASQLSRTAFLRGVFDRMQELQDEVSWTNAASLEDRTYRQFANLALLLAFVCAGTLAYYAARGYWPTRFSK